ncbi:hypothetical protein N6H14_33085 [Paenibacillus sp. CC-CFT747]|nr:hypothetical protein N6H14_33085 [Paenibacillus sp. CC-CFT747]
MRRIWMVPALSAALLLTSSASPAPPAAAGPGSEYTLLLEGAAMTLDASLS